MERGCSTLEGTLTVQLQLVVSYLRAMENRCVRCQGRQAGACQQCHLRWYTLCQQEKEECDVCSGPIPPITDPGAGGVKSYAQRSQEKGMKGAKVVSVNLHHLRESFVEKVSDRKKQSAHYVRRHMRRVEAAGTESCQRRQLAIFKVRDALDKRR